MLDKKSKDVIKPKPKTRCIPRERNNNTWTQSFFVQKIMSHLRVISRGWIPRKLPLKEACVSRGMTLCSLCKKVKPTIISGRNLTGRQENKPNFDSDHLLTVVPVVEITNITLQQYKQALKDGVDPITLFKLGVNWDERIRRLFAEDGWQALCGECHRGKTNIENTLRKEGRSHVKNGVAVTEVYKYVEEKLAERIEIYEHERR